MTDLEVVMEALSKVASAYEARGTDEGNLIGGALRDVATKILILDVERES